MKTIFFIIFILTFQISYSQTSDLLYVPEDKSLIVTYNNNSGVGFYVGGSFITYFSQQFVYTRPVAIINRLGLNLTYKNKTSVLLGASINKNFDLLDLQPEMWLKINPLRIILKTPKGFDLSFAVGYSQDIKYGLGMSINYW